MHYARICASAFVIFQWIKNKTIKDLFVLLALFVLSIYIIRLLEREKTKMLGDVRLTTSWLITSYSQRLNSGKPLGIGCCEWLWSLGTWSNGERPIYPHCDWSQSFTATGA